MRQGDTRGSVNDFFDFTYDGMLDDNYLSNGLGQLTDGEKGKLLQNSVFCVSTNKV